MRNTRGNSLATSAAGVLGVLVTLLLGIVFVSALGALPLSGAHAIEAPPSDPVVAEHADQGVEVTRKITKVTGDPALPARAGDVLQYHVAVTNVSGAAFTAANPLVFTTNVSGLASEGHVQGMHAGRNGTTYCGPTAWRTSGNSCASFGIDESGSAHVSTALAAGGTYYFNVRVQIGNEFAGDLTLTHDFCLGTPLLGSGEALCLSFAEVEIEPTYGDIEVTRQVTKITGDSDGPIRAGDVLQYHVVVTNTGDGDWTAPSAWAEDKRLTLTSDLSGLADDAVILGARQGTNRSDYYCGPKGWYSGNVHCDSLAVAPEHTISHTFALNSGKSHFFNIRVQVKNDYAGDQDLLHAVTVTGDTRGPGGVLETTDSVYDLVEVQYPDVEITRQWTKISSNDMNGPIRAGDVLQYHVVVTNTGEGDWTAPSSWAEDKRLTLTSDLGGLADDAVILGARQGTNRSDYYCGPTGWNSGNVHCDSLTVSPEHTLTHTFALNSGSSHFFNVRVQVSNDYAGDLELSNLVTVTGDTQGPAGEIVRTADTSETVAAQFPDLEVTRQWTKIRGDQNGPIRAGDLLQYHVVVTNTGDGDWTAPSAWAEDKRLTFTSDLAGIADDAVILGVRQGINGSDYYCGPEGWNSGNMHCDSLAVSPENTISHTFSLNSGASHFFNFRVQITNDYTGDLALDNTVTVTGDARGHIGIITRDATTLEHIDAQYPDLEISRQWTKITGDQDAPIRPGDILQMHATITNTGEGDWTAPQDWALDKRLTFTSDLSDLADDAIILGARQGTNNSDYYCGPTGWNSGNEHCDTLGMTESHELEHTFALAAGRSHYFNVRVQVTDHFSGDEQLFNTMCASGDTLSKNGVLTVCADENLQVTAPEPDLHVTVTGAHRQAADRDARPGDLVDYRVSVHNPGEGDWNVASAWSIGTPATLSMDLADILDDSEWVQGETGNTSIEPVNGVLEWEGALASGKTRHFDFTVRVKNLPDEKVTDRLMIGEACAQGTYRHATGASVPVEHCGNISLTITEFWQMHKVVLDAEGNLLDGTSSIRPGDLITIQTTAHAAGGWPLSNVRITDNLSDALHLGELAGDITFSLPGEAPLSLTLSDDGQVTTPQFTLPGEGEAMIRYEIRIPLDTHQDELRTTAYGHAEIEGVGARAPAICGSPGRPCLSEHRISQPAPQVVKTMTVNEADATESVGYGTVLEYVVTVTNPGPGIWSDKNPLSVVDDLTNVLDNATVIGDGDEVTVSTSWDAAETTLSPADDVIRWTGEVPAGGQVTLTYAVQVHDALAAGANRTILNEACVGAPGAERVCDEVRAVLPAMSQATPETPTSYVECVAESWIDLPVTPGVIYTIEGEVLPGHTIVVTAQARPGFTLSMPSGWVPGDDGRSATLTIHYPPCEIEAPQFATPTVEVHHGTCTATPELTLVDTEGIAYEIEGEVAAGSTVTVTATADSGYVLRSPSWQHWNISEDRQTATYTVSFPELDCADDNETGNGITPEMPKWGGSSCHFGGEEPWIELPLTEGLTYEVIAGDVARGSTITIQVTADDGEQLGYQLYWRYSDDRRNATYTVHFPELGDCDPGEGTPPEEPEPGTGDGEDEDQSGPGDSEDPDTGGGNPGETDPGNSVTVIDDLPEPEGGIAQCVDGEPVITELRVRAVPGVWYDVTGEYAPGAALVLTAHAEAGYEFGDMSEWATGDWEISEDRLTAVRVYEFPPVEELCEPWEPVDPVEPVEPVDPVDPVDPETPDPDVPDEPEVPEEPIEPDVPAEPEQPVQPEEPAQPEAPVQPDEPAQPEDPIEPTDPEVPIEPGEPEVPVLPEEPSQPEEPAEPGQPEDPTGPEAPVEPTDPEKPADPIDPEEPVEPVEPAEPELPGDPIDPGDEFDSTEEDNPEESVDVEDSDRDEPQSPPVTDGSPASDQTGEHLSATGTRQTYVFVAVALALALVLYGVLLVRPRRR